MPDVTVIDSAGELHLEGEDAAVPFDDEVDLMAATLGPEVAGPGVDGLGEGPNRKGGEGLEEPTEEGAVSRNPEVAFVAGEKVLAAALVEASRIFSHDVVVAVAAA